MNIEMKWRNNERNEMKACNNNNRNNHEKREMK
jgi:hypothetical protein